MTGTRHRRPPATVVPLVLYLLFLAYVFLSPSSEMPSTAVSVVDRVLLRLGFHELLHDARAGRVRVQRADPRAGPRAGVPGLPRWSWRDWTAVGFVLAGFVEVTQGLLLPGRDASHADVVANTLGALLGGCIATGMWRLAEGPRWRSVERRLTIRTPESSLPLTSDVSEDDLDVGARLQRCRVPVSAAPVPSDRTDGGVMADELDATRRRRRIWPWVLLGFVVPAVVLVGLGLLARPLSQVQPEAELARGELGAAEDALRGQDLDGAKAHIARAREHVDAASSRLNGFGADVWRLVPVAGGAVTDARHLVNALDQATSVAEIGTDVYPDVMMNDTLVQDGRVDLEQLDQILASVKQAGLHLRAASTSWTPSRARPRSWATRCWQRGTRPANGSVRCVRPTTRRRRCSTYCPTCSGARADAAISWR